MNRSRAILVVLVGLATASCKSASNEKVDAGQRRYCPGSLVDAGCDASVGETGAPEAGNRGGDAEPYDLASLADRPGADLAIRDSRVLASEAGVPDSSGLDLGSSGGPDVSGESGGASVDSGDGAAARAPDGRSDSATDAAQDSPLGLGEDALADGRPDSTADAAHDSPLALGADALPDGRRDSTAGTATEGPAFDVSSEAPLVRDATTLADGVASDTRADTASGADLGPDVPAGTCNIGSASWAKSWNKNAQLASTDGASPGGLAVGPDGTRWATGSLHAAVDFGGGVSLPHGSGTDMDVFLVKLDASSGAATQGFSFVDFPGATQDQLGLGVAVAQNGAVGVVGTYVGEIDFTASSSDTGTNGFDYLAKASLVQGAPMNYYVIVAGSSTGQFVTPIKAHNVDLGNGAFQAMAANPNQNLIAVCGKTSRLLAAYSATNASNTGLLTGTLPTFGGSTDMVVAAIDTTTGDVAWGRQFGGAGDQQCESVAMDDSGNVYIAGNYNGALDFGNGHALPTVATSSSIGLMFVAKLDPTGTVQAAATWGTAGVSDVYGIATGGGGSVIIAGGIGSGANANFGSVGTLTSSGLADGYVVKLDSNLNATWGLTFGDSSSNQQVNAVAVTSTGDVVIGGRFQGTLNGLGGLVSTAITRADAFTAQLSGASGALICAQGYVGDPSALRVVTAVTIAGTGAGSLADSIVVGGAFSSTITLGSTTLLSPGTASCSTDADCQGLKCSHGFCVDPAWVETFVSRLAP